MLDDPGPYGRYRREGERIVAIVEAHEDPNTYSEPTPVNSGMCCMPNSAFAGPVTRGGHANRFRDHFKVTTLSG